MPAMGAGSVFGQIRGRSLIYYNEFASLVQENNWSKFWSRLLNLKLMKSVVQLENFELIFWILTGTHCCAVC